MDVIIREKVNVANAVIAGGLTLTETDHDLEAWLMRFGSISRNFLIDDPNSEFHRHSIIEFTYSSAMKTLKPLLPVIIVSTLNPDTTFNVRALSSVYPHAASAAKEYLEELQIIANASGKSIEEVLQEELKKMKSGHSLTEPSPNSDERFEDTDAADSQLSDSTANSLDGQSSPDKSQRVTTDHAAPLSSNNFPINGIESKKSQNLAKERFNSRTSNPKVTVSPHTDLTMDMIDPLSVQKVVVEHIVRTNDTAAIQPTSFRLRSFSGKVPRPVNEPDFDTWRANVQFLLDDPSISDLSRTRRIIDSLLPPAADVIKHMSPQSSPLAYLELLESVYGSVEDGDELLAKFMTMLQNPGEKASSYLHRLQVMLSTTVRRGGISGSEQSRCLIRQFCRGCWDNGLIASLQLEKKKTNPPSFAELVVSIRTEEDRQASKEDRMRSHFGLNKQSNTSKLRTATHQMSACSRDAVVAAEEVDTIRAQISELHAQVAAIQTSTYQKGQPESPKNDDMKQLKKELRELQAQVNAMKTCISEKERPEENPESKELAGLKKQVAELKAHLTAPEPPQQRTGKTFTSKGSSVKFQNRQTEKDENNQQRRGFVTSSRPRPGYCFRCGEDGHLAINCENDPNPSKVYEKKCQLREKQAQWDLKNQITTAQLNSRQSL
ncbi:uncharacterized protein LOC122334908 [Puntigrus tetrazona]|uniref:uncharacterized protein LOC122334908 n=1 Tax=Puntigrus tetrazona TaxID=1606681 RepID=UPI001C88EB65|nr:uncharacterized protein LOC122334908 [Puntigrus tetrazona]